MTLSALFAAHFAGEPAFGVRSPGRVNLIGEHVDYNDGWVLPIAIPLQTEMMVRPRQDDFVVLHSPIFEQTRRFSLAHLEKQEGWIDYAQAVAHVLAREGIELHGFEGVIVSNVPLASGLSSSASFEVAVALAFLRGAGVSMPPDQVARLCQKAENEFIGVNCGIMDQMAVAACQADHALLLDCRDHSIRQVPFVLREHAVVVTDSSAPRELASSAYNERRAQCERAIAHFGRSLREVTPAQLEAQENALDETIFRRARHVVSEIARTQSAVKALEGGDLTRFGQEMNQSHFSLRDDYEVSSRELDVLTDFARDFEGVLGSRMTGAGFGGCTVTLVEKARADALIEAQLAHYERETGRQGRAYICHAASGASLFQPA